MAAVWAGWGETAHEARRQGERQAVALAMREEGREPDLLDRLAGMSGCCWTRVQPRRPSPTRRRSIGAAEQQVADVVAAAQRIIDEYPEAAAHTPAPIL